MLHQVTYVIYYFHYITAINKVYWVIYHNVGVRNPESVTETQAEFISSSTAEKVALWVAAHDREALKRYGCCDLCVQLLWSLTVVQNTVTMPNVTSVESCRQYPRYICGTASARAYACACCKYVRSVVSMGHERNFQLSITVVILPEHWLRSRPSFVV